MKICFLRNSTVSCNYETIQTTPVGGTESALIYIAHYLARLGHDVQVFNGSPSGVFGGVKHTQVSGLDSFLKLVKHQGPCDALIYAGCDNALNPHLQNIPARTRILWAQNDWEADESYERYDAIVCVSNSHRLRYSPYNFFRKTYFIHNGVEERHFPENLLAVQKKNQAAYVGVLVPSKGVHIVLGSWDRVRSIAPGARLVVVGSVKIYGDRPLGRLGVAEPDYEARLIRPYVLTAEGRLREDVKFLGPLDHRSLGLRLAESLVALVNPSPKSIETCCAAALEAQACGTAVIGVRAGALPEVILHEQTGLIVSAGSDSAYARAVAGLLNQPEKAIALGLQGRKFVTGNFLYSLQARKWDTLLGCLLTQAPIPASFRSNWYAPPGVRHALYTAVRYSGQGYRLKRWKQLEHRFSKRWKREEPRAPAAEMNSPGCDPSASS